MATTSWTPGISGAWSTAADWSGGTVPANSGTSVVLGGTGGYAVSLLATDVFGIGALTLSDAQASLDVAGQLSVTALTNAGTIAITGTAGAFDASGVVANHGLVSVSAGAALWLDPGSALASAGSIAIGATGTLGIDTAVTLASLATVSNSGGLIDIYGGGTLTLGGAVAVSGATGLLSGLALDGGTLMQGTLDNTGGSLALDGTLDAIAWQGAMTIGAQQSVTVIGGLTVTTAAKAPGTITLAGGRLAVGDSETLNAMTVLATSSTAGADYIENAGQADGSPSGVLTFGNTFTLSQAGGMMFLQNPGSTTSTVNDGHMLITGGTLVLQEGSLSNAGTLALSAGAQLVVKSHTTVASSGLIDANGGGISALVFNVNSVGNQLTNLAGGVFTGGTLQADAGSTLDIDASGKLATDNATLILNGAGSVIRFYDPGTSRDYSIGSTLGTVEGTLLMENGATLLQTPLLVDDGMLQLASGAAITLGGTLIDNAAIVLNGGSLVVPSLVLGASGSLQGAGRVTDVHNSTLANAGAIAAQGGLLTLSGTVAGSGSLSVGVAATLELGSGDSEAVSFAGVGSLRIDNPKQVSGAIAGIVAGDTIELGKTAASTATLAGGVLTVQLQKGGTETFQASGAAGLAVSVTQDGLGDSSLSFATATAQQAASHMVVQAMSDIAAPPVLAGGIVAPWPMHADNGAGSVFDQTSELPLSVLHTQWHGGTP